MLSTRVLEKLPRGLKPASFCDLYGTLRLRSGQAKAVPFQNLCLCQSPKHILNELPTAIRTAAVGATAAKAAKAAPAAAGISSTVATASTKTTAKAAAHEHPQQAKAPQQAHSEEAAKDRQQNDQSNYLAAICPVSSIAALS